MNTSELLYEGELRTIATHVYSRTQIFTDAPIDNFGKAQSFSPTDLVATALGSCMVTIMGIECNKQNWNIDGTKMFIQKKMTINPRRIAEIHIQIEIPGSNLDIDKRNILEQLAVNCPVAKSLHPDIKQEIVFKFV
jgi:putative redox protein